LAERYRRLKDPTVAVSSAGNTVGYFRFGSEIHDKMAVLLWICEGGVLYEKDSFVVAKDPSLSLSTLEK
jgi:hypothetical protein